LDGGRVAVVTGGSSGIGRATAGALVAQGYRVVICARGGDRLEQTAGELGRERVAWHACDVGDPSSAAKTIALATERFGRLDALVCAAGVIGSFQPIAELTPEGWDKVLRVNLMGPIHFARAAIPALRETRGSVVIVSSVNAHQAEPGMAPYGVSKAGLVGFTMYAALECAPHGIRVNCVAPGWVLTPMAEPFFREAGLLDTPVAFNMQRRPARPEELASVIAFLVGDGASFMTGTTVVADGGMITQMAGLRPADDQQEVEHVAIALDRPKEER
jgi:meso-butanediol dehydrogenase/(S,S)-butanediol dehydrogenase/diacetyl reductase